MLDVAPYLARLASAQLVNRQGRVTRVAGLSIEAEGLRLSIGDLCQIAPEDGNSPLVAEVVGFSHGRLQLAPFGEVRGVRPGSAVTAAERLLAVPAGPELLGRVLNGLGCPIDDRGPLTGTSRVLLGAAPPHPLRRAPITVPLETGVRAIDGLLTCGRGQRLGIFAGSGVGKSTLLGMIGRYARSDVNVVALIGERGREVQEFIERDLGPDGLARSVLVVATSDQPAPLRLKAAWVATAIAEQFREQGCNVTFMMDSVTRFAMAQREVGLTAGEPPAMRGYPPSVFALLPQLLERTGTSDRGTITGFYTVLVEGDDTNEPIADTVRGILDGHIVLTRELAAQNHFPAIDVLASISRLMRHITPPEHQQDAAAVRDVLATYHAARDLVSIGAYVAGSNPQIDRALELLPAVVGFLRQPADEFTAFGQTAAALAGLAAAGMGEP